MPAIRTHAARQKKPPAGFDDIRDDLEVFSIKMKDAQNAPTNNVPKHQAQWPIFQIAHQRSRYVYDLYYDKEAISRQLYDWLLKNGYADPMLIAKWKKQGYEKVCLPRRGGLACFEASSINFFLDFFSPRFSFLVSTLTDCLLVCSCAV